MGKIFHISKTKRQSKSGLCLGGVEKFALYLQRAVPELQIIEFFDHPDWTRHTNIPDYEQAELLNGYLCDAGVIKPGDTVIVDGYWGRGLEDSGVRLISVCHGSYVGTLVQMDRYPWSGEPNLGQHMQAQEKFWQEADCEIVSVSKQAAHEIKMLSSLDSTVIFNGVDLEVFRPRPERRVSKLVLHAATGNRKGADVVEVIFKAVDSSKLTLDHLRAMNGILEQEAKRWCEASAALFPTRYEGCAYARLEAAACGVPQVTYATGEALEFDRRVGDVLDDLHPVPFLHHLLDMLANPERYDPHAWAREHADFNRFAADWRNYLEI